jgi:hypothetical protein
MKRFSILSFVLLLAVSASPLVAQSSGDPSALVPEGPGPEHAILAELSGAWTSSVTFSFLPGGPVTGPGSTNNQMILGGRFIQMNGVSELLGTRAGTMQIVGFDNRSRRYTLFGIDELGTYSITAEGALDSASGTIDLLGADTDPKSGHTMEFRIRISRPVDNRYTFVVQYKEKKSGNYQTMVSVVNTKS